MIKGMLNEAIDAAESIAEIIKFIKDKNNILSERYELFVASLDILPKGTKRIVTGKQIVRAHV